MTTTAATSPFPTTRSDVPGLAGYTLSKPTLLDIADIEDHFTRQHTSAVLAAAKEDGPEAYSLALAHVEQMFARRPCAWMTAGFDVRVNLHSNLPYLLSICLRKVHPGTTEGQARALITDENFVGVREAVLGLFGYHLAPEGVAKNAGSPPPTVTAGGPSHGSTSGPGSDAPASTPTGSAA